jgi:hypothetical protein
VKKIKQTVHAEAHHPAVQNVQDIFRQHEKRLYPWAKDRGIPAENNLAERDLRSRVIARKNSFGSQSDKGAHTRETLMTVLHTLKKRTDDVHGTFKSALDRLAADPTLDPYLVLFQLDTSCLPVRLPVRVPTQTGTRRQETQDNVFVVPTSPILATALPVRTRRQARAPIPSTLIPRLFPEKTEGLQSNTPFIR